MTHPIFDIAESEKLAKTTPFWSLGAEKLKTKYGSHEKIQISKFTGSSCEASGVSTFKEVVLHDHGSPREYPTHGVN